ncbi:MAG: hypothetical protein E7406_09215 [Ruminococcaceae bacterium]|nr:hypothetical protein [Oscillospiraceae bacterium]
MMKKSLLICGLLFAAFISFFNPLECQFNLSVPRTVNCMMILFLLVKFYTNREKISSVKLSKWETFLGAFLGLCLNLGHGLFKGSGFDIFYGSALAIAVSIFSTAFYVFFGIYVLKFFFCKTQEWLETESITRMGEKCRLFGYLIKHIKENRFSFYFLFFLVAWLLPFIINFPGFVMFDTRNQIDMYYHIPNHHTNASALLDSGQYITQHHSVPHTLFLGAIFDFGMKLFGTYEAGIFMYCIIQYVFMAAIVGYMFKSINCYLGTKWTLLGILLLGLHPFFPISAILITKDIWFCGLFIVYVLKYYELMRDPDKLRNKAFFVKFLALAILLILLRNNAFYSLILISFALLLFMKNRIHMIAYTCIFMVFSILYSSVLLPRFDISPGSPREMLSIPFQQTARYINEFPDEVTEEEKEIIGKIIDYEAASTQYDPELSDAVKDTYNKYATTDELKDYFGVWFKMLLKHPVVYIEAFIEQNYGYYYPGVKYPMTYDCDNDYSAKVAMRSDGIKTLNVEKPGFIQRGYYWVQYVAYHTPFLCLLTDTGSYMWLWLFLILLIIRKFENKKKYLLYYIPYFAYMILYLIGPANGTIYLRYVMPFIYTFPLALLPLFEYKAEKKIS